MVFEKISSCPLCGSANIAFLLESGKDSDRALFVLLGVPYEKSQWWHCESCNHVFLNPRFTVEIESRLYGKESLYRKYSMEGVRQEDYLLSIDSTISDGHKIHKGHANLVGRIFKVVPKEEIGSILDFGAGFGAAYTAIASLGYEYVGLELDEWCLGIAKYLERNVVKSLKDESTKYDLIYTSQVFEHIQIPESVFSLLKNNLNENGYLFINVPTHEWKRVANLSGAGLGCLNWGHYHSYSADSLGVLLEQNGFAVKHVWYGGGDISVLGQLINLSVHTKGGKAFSRSLEAKRIKVLKITSAFYKVYRGIVKHAKTLLNHFKH